MRGGGPDTHAVSVGFISDWALLALEEAQDGELTDRSRRALERAAEFLDTLSQAGVDISKVSLERTGALSAFQYAAEAGLLTFGNVDVPPNLRSWFGDLAGPLRSVAAGEEPDPELVSRAQRFLKALSEATFAHWTEQSTPRAEPWTLR